MATKQTERRQAWKEAGLCYYCGSEKDDQYAACSACRKKRRGQGKERPATYYSDYRQRIRIEVIEHYGGACVCCGEDEPTFLELDHINNDGAQHRRELMGDRNAAGIQFYRKLRSLGYPEGIVQVLCANCHRAKSSFGQCIKHASGETPRTSEDVLATTKNNLSSLNVENMPPVVARFGNYRHPGCGYRNGLSNTVKVAEQVTKTSSWIVRIATEEQKALHDLPTASMESSPSPSTVRSIPAPL